MTEEAHRKLDWKLVVATSLLGLVFAALTISGSIPDVRSTQWLGLALVTVIGLAVGAGASHRVFQHGLSAGFLAGLLVVETQALFLPTYFANNPQYAEIEVPFGWPPRLATAVLGPLNAVVAGLIVGVLAWTVRRILGGHPGAAESKPGARRQE